MATPKKEAIVQRATELWHNDRAKNGDPSFDIEPELEELKESGWLSVAQSELMRSQGTEYEQYIAEEKDQYSETKEFEIDIAEALNSGIFISGTSASGKSNLGFIVSDMLMRKGVTVYAIDPSQAWQRSSIPNRIMIPKPMKVEWRDPCSTVFDISRLNVLQQKIFVEGFCRTIFNARANSEYRPKTFIFFEEAHLYFPEGCMRAKSYQEALRIVTVGRNFNVRFGLITQWCALIDKVVLRFPRQKWFGYTDEKNDVQYLQNFVGDKANELETLEVGEFLYDYGKVTKKVKVPLFKEKVKVIA